MATTKNLCAQISLELHQKISEGKEAAGLTTALYITNLLLEYYEMKENGGNTTMANSSRTMTFQISDRRNSSCESKPPWSARAHASAERSPSGNLSWVGSKGP